MEDQRFVMDARFSAPCEKSADNGSNEIYTPLRTVENVKPSDSDVTNDDCTVTPEKLGAITGTIEPKTDKSSSTLSRTLKEKKKQALSSKKLEKFNEAQSRRGVIYLSSIPPYMKPAKLKHLLALYGQVDRMYLVPEDSSKKRKRVKMGGNRKTKFTEGWVEYLDKSIAKRVVLTLHGQPLGGRGFFASDIWNMKYLSKFKWHHLTEKIAYERRVREKKMQTELVQQRKQDNFYLARVEQAKSIEKMRERRNTLGKIQETEEGVIRRKFFQRSTINENNSKVREIVSKKRKIS